MRPEDEAAALHARLLNDCDGELLERIKASDADAYAILVRRYWPALRTYARRLLRDTDTAQDVVQETFVRIWERREAWRQKGSVAALLFRICRNLAVDERRRPHTRVLRLQGKISEAVPTEGTAADQVHQAELSDVVARAIEALPAKRREVFTLARLKHLSYHEIGELMRLSPQTVANLVSLALADLRAALTNYLDPSQEADGSTRSRPLSR